jgi:hypothetical protein
MRFLAQLLVREFRGYPIWGWLVFFALIGLCIWGALTIDTDTCHRVADGLDCGG